MNMCCAMMKSIYVNPGHTRFVILINITSKMKTAKSKSCLISIELVFIICKANILLRNWDGFWLKPNRKIESFHFFLVVLKGKFQTPALRRMMFRRNFLKFGVYGEIMFYPRKEICIASNHIWCELLQCQRQRYSIEKIITSKVLSCQYWY